MASQGMDSPVLRSTHSPPASGFSRANTDREKLADGQASGDISKLDGHPCGVRGPHFLKENIVEQATSLSAMESVAPGSPAESIWVFEGHRRSREAGQACLNALPWMHSHGRTAMDAQPWTHSHGHTAMDGRTAMDAQPWTDTQPWTHSHGHRKWSRDDEIPSKTLSYVNVRVGEPLEVAGFDSGIM
ncbi:hypothetical protein BS47DRAFT_1364145 [Hydnum rufescens UP504]|uniref:Uncharacterized protein n=1 Tax=Hydnum rufescens UP504 TaxID=1448309 RepID=A0A9P6AS34_9AGAM|nr:hypothetical protein BS47DRAFT_1364145 [Hydnum rufescens UP504]